MHKQINTLQKTQEFETVMEVMPHGTWSLDKWIMEIGATTGIWQREKHFLLVVEGGRCGSRAVCLRVQDLGKPRGWRSASRNVMWAPVPDVEACSRSRDGKQEPTSAVVVMQRILEIKWRSAKKAGWVPLWKTKWCSLLFFLKAVGYFWYYWGFWVYIISLSYSLCKR